jgi:hypothetical protein
MSGFKTIVCGHPDKHPTWKSIDLLSWSQDKKIGPSGTRCLSICELLF